MKNIANKVTDKPKKVAGVKTGRALDDSAVSLSGGLGASRDLKMLKDA